AMAEAGADVLVPHMGLTTGGTIGAGTAPTLDEGGDLIQEMHDAPKKVPPDNPLLCPRGAPAPPPKAAPAIEPNGPPVGFFGAPSMEPLPTETAITENMRRFKAIPV